MGEPMHDRKHLSAVMDSLYPRSFMTCGIMSPVTRALSEPFGFVVRDKPGTVQPAGLIVQNSDFMR